MSTDWFNNTFYLSELVESLESGGVVCVVGFERDSKEVTVGYDVVLGVVSFRATQPDSSSDRPEVC